MHLWLFCLPDETPAGHSVVGLPEDNEAQVQSAIMRSIVSFLKASDGKTYFALHALPVCTAYFHRAVSQLKTRLAEPCEHVSLLTQTPAFLGTIELFIILLLQVPCTGAAGLKG